MIVAQECAARLALDFLRAGSLGFATTKNTLRPKPVDGKDDSRGRIVQKTNGILARPSGNATWLRA